MKRFTQTERYKVLVDEAIDTRGRIDRIDKSINFIGRTMKHRLCPAQLSDKINAICLGWFALSAFVAWVMASLI